MWSNKSWWWNNFYNFLESVKNVINFVWRFLINFKIEKNTSRYYHFTHLHHKWQYGAEQTDFLSFWTIFLPFHSPFLYGPRKSKIWKNEKNNWRYYHFINVYNKWQSYDKWFLRYEVWLTEFFVVLDHFLPFYPPNNPKNQ